MKMSKVSAVVFAVALAVVAVPASAADFEYTYPTSKNSWTKSRADLTNSGAAARKMAVSEYPTGKAGNRSMPATDQKSVKAGASKFNPACERNTGKNRPNRGGC